MKWVDLTLAVCTLTSVVCKGLWMWVHKRRTRKNVERLCRDVQRFLENSR